MSSNDQHRDRTFVARYGATILRGGIAAIPAALYRYQGELGLSAQCVWFISAILAHKWDADLPYPSLKRLAEQTGVSRRQLHNYQRELVENKWLKVINRQTELGGKDTNLFDFTPLFARLELLLERDQAGKGGQDSGNGRYDKNSTPHVNHSSHTHVHPRSHPHVNPAAHHKEPVEAESEISKFERQPTQDFSDDEREDDARRAESPLEVSEPSDRSDGQPPPSTPVLDDPGAKFGHPDEPSGSVPTPGYQRLRNVALAHRATLATDEKKAGRRGEATLGELIQSRQQMANLAKEARNVATANLEPAARKDQPEPEATLPPSRQEGAPEARTGSRRGRPPGSREAREILTAYLADFAKECNDQAPLAATVTRAYRLFEQAGVPKERYADVLYQCRAIVKERSGQITKQVNNPSGVFTTKNKMPYFLAVLIDQLGLKEESDEPNPPDRTPAVTVHQPDSTAVRPDAPSSP